MHFFPYRAAGANAALFHLYTFAFTGLGHTIGYLLAAVEIRGALSADAYSLSLFPVHSTFSVSYFI
jgi:hypothetical protein